MNDISDLIGIPFHTHGRSKKTGYDCYGLAIEVSKRFGHKLPDLWYNSSTSQMFTEKCSGVLEELKEKVCMTSEQEPGNLVCFFENGNMVHIGVIVGTDKFIHCDRLGVRILSLSDYYRKQWRIYRWQ